MKRKFYLLSLKISGIKNIEEDIQIQFYKKTMDKNFDPEKYRVKAIYGENGSGKTAIVTAVYILRQLMCSESYLSESTNQKFLREIINKKTEKFQIEAEYREYDSPDNSIYKYQIEISKRKTDRYVVKSESLWIKSGNYAAAKYRIVYTCEDGEIIGVNAPSIEEALKRKTANLLETRTLLCAVINNFDEFLEVKMEKEFAIPLLKGMLFAVFLQASIEESDQHNLYFMQQVAYDSDDSDSVLNDVLQQILDLLNERQRHSEKAVHKDDFKEYEKTVKQMESFIKCFKHDLQTIEIDKRENKEYFECKLVMRYEDYAVDIEFESTGIKKLMRLFDYIQFATQGGIVFIDEMDSNINDVYLCKLIEFFMRYGKGQLCFTTHNTSPMAVLREGKNSIDFLSNDNTIISWKRNGNFSPENLYRNGMIEYMPFNIEAEDFIGVLGN